MHEDTLEEIDLFAAAHDNDPDVHPPELHQEEPIAPHANPPAQQTPPAPITPPAQRPPPLPITPIAGGLKEVHLGDDSDDDSYDDFEKVRQQLQRSRKRSLSPPDAPPPVKRYKPLPKSKQTAQHSSTSSDDDDQEMRTGPAPSQFVGTSTDAGSSGASTSTAAPSSSVAAVPSTGAGSSSTRTASTTQSPPVIPPTDATIAATKAKRVRNVQGKF